MKKFISLLAIIGLTTVAQAQYVYTNVSVTTGWATTNALMSGKFQITEITIANPNAAATLAVSLYDRNGASNRYSFSAYNNVITFNYTNTYYFTNTYGLIITNNDIGSTVSNSAVSAGVAALPVIFSTTVPPSTSQTRAVDIVTMRGLAGIFDTNANVTIKYRPYSIGQ